VQTAAKRCRKCGILLTPYVNWSESRIIRHDFICKVCNSPAQSKTDTHWEKHRRKFLQEHIGFLDIETSGHDANFGLVFCYAIASSRNKQILGCRITKDDLAGDMDKRLLVQCLKDLEKFDRVVTYYGSRFDVPFLRTRCLYHRLPFPEYGQIFHTDLYYTVKYKLRLGRNSQEVALRFLTGDSEKTHFGRDYWIKAMTGNEKALRYIFDHCKRDVRDLRRLYEILVYQRGYSKRGM